MGEPTARVPEDATRVTLRRGIAHFVDIVVITLILFVLAFPAGAISDVALLIVLVGWAILGQLAYFVWFQRRDGKTPGKQLAGIRVVDANGATPSTGALVKRTLPLYLEYVYFIALIGMLTSRYRQRFGDRWGDTYVVAE